MQNSMVVFILCFRLEIPFSGYPYWQICSKKSKLSVSVENWYTDYFEYEQFNGDVYFSCFRQKCLFLDLFCNSKFFAEAAI